MYHLGGFLSLTSILDISTALMRPRRPKQYCLQLMKGVVSKETVVLRRWGSNIQKFSFINGVDNVNWPPYRDPLG